MIGQNLGHYRIVDKLGEGGMGVVYLAEDTTLGREIALKVLPPELAEDPDRLERFQREARTLASLDHPNIVTIHSVESADNVHFITMQRVEGRQLSELIRSGGMALDRIFEIAIPLADALATAHTQGIIHRDLKPGNVMVGDRGQVKVLDFGLAKLRADTTTLMATEVATEPLTGEGRILGTLPYMSPEQLEGKELDGRSDVFSLGVMLYEMATGKRPFQGDSSASLIMSIGRDTPTSVDLIRSDLPHHLSRVIGRCLEKDPELRFQTVKDVRNELRSLQRETESRDGAVSSSDIAAAAPATAPGASPVAGPASGPVASSAATPVSAAAVGFRSRTWIVVLVAALAVIAALTGWLLWRVRTPAETTENTATPAAAVLESPRSVAVLPFSNLSGRADLDFLALAIPDEVTTTLSYARGLEVRPFTLTRKYQDPGVDPQAVGREVRSSSVLTGQYTVEGERLQVTLEAIDVEGNSLIWRDRVSVAADDPLALRDQVATTVREALLPALGGAGDVASLASPTNAEAYRLYLQSLAISRDPEPNRRAIATLERVVELDPGFASAWAALSTRYSYLGYYGGLPTIEILAALDKVESAAKRALELNPRDLEAAGTLTFRAVENGQMGEAYRIAHQALEQNPDLGQVHFIVSYVYRYTGLLDDAARECNRALELSPTALGARSCTITFYRLGDLDRARDFLSLDADSVWAYRHEGLIEVYAGNLDRAAELFDRDPNFEPTEFVTHCRSAPDSDATRRGLETTLEIARTSPDPEIRYHFLALVATCGFGERALEILPSVAEAGYCAPEIFDEAPFRDLKGRPGWEAVQAANDACFAEFLEAKRKIDTGA